MTRRLFLAGAALLALAGPALARSQAIVDRVVADLRRQGYTEFEVGRTLLGRVLIDAKGRAKSREIVLNPFTGEILRDVATTTTCSAAAMTTIGPDGPTTTRTMTTTSTMMTTIMMAEAGVKPARRLLSPLSSRQVVLAVAVLLQFACTFFFVSDILLSVLGLRTEPIPWRLRELLEIGAALGLITGLVLGGLLLRAAMRQTSDGTVKAQTAAIYRKAGVSGRPQHLSLFVDELMDGGLPVSRG